jgi:hypothetical protein
MKDVFPAFLPAGIPLSGVDRPDGHDETYSRLRV